MLNIQNRQVPTGNEVTPKGITFLSPRHVTKEGIVAKVIGCTNAESTPPTGKRDNYNNPVVVRWTFNGQKYEKGFKLTSDNLAAQARILGNDETKWAGQSILIAKTLGDEGDERLAFLPVPKGKK